MTEPANIRVELPFHLQRLAGVSREVELKVDGAVTRGSVLDALEAKYPMLRGTIRDHVTLKRRPFLRFFACAQDLSDTAAEAPLPEKVARGEEAFLVVGAIAGGGGEENGEVVADDADRHGLERQVVRASDVSEDDSGRGEPSGVPLWGRGEDRRSTRSVGVRRSVARRVVCGLTGWKPVPPG